MKTEHTKPLYSKKEIITKEVIRGHLRNWLCEIVTKKKYPQYEYKDPGYYFIFEMENIMIKDKTLIFAYGDVLSPKNVVFYIDNIMRAFLFYDGNNGSYLEATKKNLAKLKKMLKATFKEQL